MHSEKLIQTVARITRDLWDKGWIEANGGNCSIRLNKEEKAGFKSTLPDIPISLARAYPELAGEVLLITGSGKFLRNIELNPLENIGFIKINESGNAYSIAHGFTDGGQPTSELPTHLSSHALIKESGNHVVLHCHATNLVTLTCVKELTTPILSKMIWQLQSESVLVFPQGIEFIPWQISSTLEIGEKTAQALKKRTLALWQYHGVFATGKDSDEALGRIHVAEKAAEIYLKAKSAGGIHSVLSDQQLVAMADYFNLDYDRAIMDTKTDLK